MKIGIDAREIENGVHTGIGRALSVFLDYFESQEDGNTGVLFSTRSIERADSLRIQKVVARPAMTLIWDQFTLPRLIRNATIDLFYSTYYKIPLAAACPCVSTIYDLMYLTFPVYRDKSVLSRLYYKTFGSMCVNKASRIVTGSAYSQKEIAAFYRMNPEKIISIPLGVPQRFHPVSKLSVEQLKRRIGIERDYVLYTGNFKPHKNITGLIKSFKIVHDRFPAIILVLAGHTGHHIDAIATQIAVSGLEGNITILGPINEADLPGLYSGARLFAMPSLYEGFGYPPLEAMACGTPVVCSDATSLPEVVGDGALLVNANDPQDMANGMIQILESPDLARLLSIKGLEHARLFSGERYAEKVYDVLLQRKITPSGLAVGV
jgi:glycosyltransferase involved in cell wall biosynthesis